MYSTCQELLLSSLTDFYNDNPGHKIILKEIIDGKHRLSLRLIDWFVTHYSKSLNVYYWIYKSNTDIFETYPSHISDTKDCKRVNLYLDYRAQLKSYAKINFDSFRRHDRITFFIDLEKNEFIETTVGQLNFFRWIFNNNVIQYIINNYDDIYQNMIDNNTFTKSKKTKRAHNNVQDITNTICTLRFD
jgi:hypothetical protein